MFARAVVRWPAFPIAFDGTHERGQDYGSTEPDWTSMSLLDELRRLTAKETDAITAARDRADQQLRVPPPEIGSLLRWAARSTSARAVVEIGSAGGVTAIWTLQGMDKGLVTSVESDPSLHVLADKAWAEAGVEERVRSILGDPLEVLPRLSDASYDLVTVQVPAHLLGPAFEHALRLVRPGGTILARSLLEAQAVPVAVTSLLDEEHVTGSLLPLDDGILLATVTTVDS